MLARSVQVKPRFVFGATIEPMRMVRREAIAGVAGAVEVPGI